MVHKTTTITFIGATIVVIVQVRKFVITYIIHFLEQ